MNKTVPAVILAAVAIAGARPGTSDAYADDEKATGPKPVIPLTLQVVFSRYQGDKKVASAPYVLPLNANERGSARLRMGINVPLRTENKDSPSSVVYKSVGNNMDCNAESAEGNRFKVRCSLEQSSVYPSGPGDKVNGAAADGPPLLRTFNTEATLYLKDGQTAQYAMATDPVTGEVLKVDVTLTVLK